jgi:Xaa-Pro aminopeptidase
MDASEGLLAIRKEMAAQRIDLLVAFHDGAHFIEKPNAVMALTGFKSIGPTAVVLTPDGDVTIIVTPRWDADRAAEAAHVTHSLGADDLTAALADHLSAFHSQSAITGAIVYGDSRNHAELAYLSHFTPKLGPALMLIPRNGEPTLLVSGAPNMLPAARRMTWIENTRPLNDPVSAVERWLKEIAPSSPNASTPRLGLIGGDWMRAALRRPIETALIRANGLEEATAAVRTLMRNKRPRELAIIREACGILGTAAKALRMAQSSGASPTTAILDAEQAAYGAGAQDVRTLFSADGGRSVRPFEYPLDAAVDPLQAYIAVRHFGYWAEGFMVCGAAPQTALQKAALALTYLINSADAGARCSDLSRLAARAVRPYGEHPVSAGGFGNGIGLFLEEEPRLSDAVDEQLQAGSVYTLRVGCSDGRTAHAIVSAMIAIDRNRTEVLWSALD